MIVAVLDTNVLVSGFPARRGVPATLLEAWRRGLYRLVVSEPILGELAETWQDPYWLATAVASKADFLVTGDRKLRALGTFRNVALVSPREFLDRLTQDVAPDS